MEPDFSAEYGSLIRKSNNKIINGEYFFRTDKGFGDCSPVTFAIPSADGSFIINIPTNTYRWDADTLFVRVRGDNADNWSHYANP